MATERAEVVIAGAGIAGLACAHALTQRGIRDIVVADPEPPLSVTSDKSTECYRNWWPGPDAAMTQLMNRSIDLLEAIPGIGMNRRGYLFLTRRPERFEAWRDAARQAEEFGAGPLTEGPSNQANGANLLPDAHTAFPYLEPGMRGLWIRRAGWLKSDLLGRYWLDRCREAGVRFVRAAVTAIDRDRNGVSGVRLRRRDGSESEVNTRNFVNAAGPGCAPVAALAGLELPVFSELHLKVNFHDVAGAMPRSAPLLILDDPISLPWDNSDAEALAADPSTSFLTREFPAGIHGRPEGGDGSRSVLLLWTYHLDPVEPVFPFSAPPYLAEIVVRGMSRLLPAFAAYHQGFPTPIVDGGYYTKTRENRPLVGATPIRGLWLCCALSGYGIMASAACGELLAAHLCGEALPDYAAAFELRRYDRPDYQARLATWHDASQL